MERFLIRGLHIILPGLRWLYEPQVGVQQAASGVGVSTQCGAVSTRETIIFVAGLLELYMHGRIHAAGMGPYPPRVALALQTPG